MIKSDNNSSLFISQKYEQGEIEGDWSSYTPSLEVVAPVEILSGSTATLIKTGAVVEVGSTILCQEGTDTAVVSGTVDGFTEKTWDVGNAVYEKVFSVGTQETSPSGLFFKSDGTLMYVIGYGGDDVNQYNLSTPWDVGTAVYEKLFSVASQETTPTGLFFKSDGTRMYVIGATGADVNQYNLSTPWDVGTAVYEKVFYVGTQEGSPSSLFFKSDGTRMYVIGSSGDAVYQYNLSTPWDVGTAVYEKLFSVGAQEAYPSGLFFKSDGTRMYVIGSAGDDVNQYNLSTPWDVGTAVYEKLFSVASQETNPQGLFFKSDGTRMYVIGSSGDDVNQYTIPPNEIDITSLALSSVPTAVSKPVTVHLNTAFEDTPGRCNCIDIPLTVDSSTTTGIVASITAESELFPLVSTDSIAVDDELKVIVNDIVTDVIVSGVSAESLAILGDITDFVYEKLFSVASQETSPSGLFFKPDGTRMYVIGSSGDDVNQYNLSTPWDVGTAVYEKLFSVASQETSPSGLFFKPDGTRMYVIGSSGDDVNQYNLSTPWDVGTAVYEKLFSVASQETNPQGLFFKSDGAKMYVIGYTGDDVNQYNLSTPWDVGTAVYEKLFSVASQETTPSGLFFKPDGTRMYVIGYGGAAVNQYNLSSNTTIWDTALYCTFTLTIPEQTHAPTTATILDRSTSNSIASSVWGQDGKIVHTFDPVHKIGRALQYNLQGTTDVEVHKVKYDLERI